jgi:hypothetical protein
MTELDGPTPSEQYAFERGYQRALEVMRKDQQREWQGLTDEEMNAAMDYWSDPVRSAYGGAHSADGEYVGMIDTWRYIEAKLKEKNA